MISITPGPPPAPPIIWGEICLCFRCDRSARDLLDIIPIIPTKLASRSETKYNPIEQCQNPGYWIYETAKECSFETAALFQNLDDLLKRHMETFQKAKQQFAPCDMFVRLYVQVCQQDEFPTIRISSDMNGTMAALGAYLDIIVEDVSELYRTDH